MAWNDCTGLFRSDKVDDVDVSGLQSLIRGINDNL